jgi:glycosyltransferase involved in cell wall biosynthesis
VHIAYVLKQFPKLSETFILNEMLELERQGEELTVFSTEPCQEERIHPGVARLKAPVIHLGGFKGERSADYLRRNLDALRPILPRAYPMLERMLTCSTRDPFKLMHASLLLAVECQRRGIEHLHAHFANLPAEMAWAANGMTGIPYTFTCHAKDIYHESVDLTAFRRIAASAQALITVCRANQDHLRREMLQGIEIDVVCLYNGIDLQAFHPRDRVPDADPLVLGVGRLVEKKGFATLIRAMAMLQSQGRDVRCAIVGEGREREALESIIAETGCDQVRLLGAKTQDEVKQLLHRSTLLALPCEVGEDGNRDALPTVLLEALACGLPAVSTPVVGVGEILADGSAGELVPPRDPRALASAMAKLLDQPDLRQRYGEEGRNRAERLFDARANVSELRAVFAREIHTRAVAM